MTAGARDDSEACVSGGWCRPLSQGALNRGRLGKADGHTAHVERPPQAY